MAKRSRPTTGPTAWATSPQNPSVNPKISDKLATKIAEEAITKGDKWDVQEAINKRRKIENAIACGSSSGKSKAPSPIKLDAAVRKPRCLVGEGAYGSYFVHPSKQYGVKVFKDPDYYDSAEWEFYNLGVAHATGVNVPEPLSINATTKGTETLVMRHLDGYKPLDSVYLHRLPTIVKLKTAREFRKLHLAGISHGDIHGGNILTIQRSRKVAIIDLGYSMNLNKDGMNPYHYRDAVDNLELDLERLPRFLEIPDRQMARYESTRGTALHHARNYSRDWEKYDVAINRYHDAIEAEIRASLGSKVKPRSRFVRGVDQPRIPGITRRILEGQINSAGREGIHFELRHGMDPTREKRLAKQLGLNPKQLKRAIDEEMNSRLRRMGMFPDLLGSS